MRHEAHICWANRKNLVANEALYARAALASGPIISPEIFATHSVFLSDVVLNFVGLDQAPNTVIVYELDRVCDRSAATIAFLTPQEK